MQKTHIKSKKKVYEKPKVLFQKQLEALAVACDSTVYLGQNNCRKTGCEILQS